MSDLAELDAGFEPNPQPNAGIYVQFYYHTGKDDRATKAEGRPIYKDYEYIRVRVAGDNSSVIERPATVMDKRRFYKQYEQFKRQEEQKPEGFALEEWPGISRSQVLELKFFNVHTVEQLAAVSDAHGQKFVGFMGLRNKAIAYLAKLKEEAPAEKMREELAARDAEIAQLKSDLASLVADMKVLRKEK